MRLSHLRRGALALTITVVAIGGAGCGSENESQRSAGTNASTSEGKVQSIGVLLPGKLTDAGFTGVARDAAETAAKKHGIEDVKFAQSVTAQRAEEAFRSFGQAGVDLIIGWGGNYQDAAKKVAPEFPDSDFMVTAGANEGNGSNFASSNFSRTEWNYLVGDAIGKASKSKKIGYISGTCFPALAAGARALNAGAKRADPNIKTTYVGLSSFEDPAAAKQATLAMISGGTDIIATNLNTGNAGVFEAAQSKPGTLATTFFSDQTDQAPDVILTGVVLQQDQIVDRTIEAIEDGSFDGKPITVGLSEDEQAILPFRGLAPDSIFDDAKKLQAEIAAGNVDVPDKPGCPFG